MTSDQPQIDENEQAQSPQADATAVEPEAEAENAATEDESLEAQLEKAQATIKDYWDQVVRLGAEIENNRKRAIRDVENAHKFALRNFVEALLPVIDSMEMGQVAAESDSASLESIREGSKLTMNMFVQALRQQGLQQINPLGEKFDPEQHQAISMIDAKGAESNTVVDVMQKGFTLNERLVRPALVVVAK